jgi:hypothetical protein
MSGKEMGQAVWRGRIRVLSCKGPFMAYHPGRYRLFFLDVNFSKLKNRRLNS